ncbi:serine/threonine transporter SstT [Clostridium sp. CMCC3677]|uniref:serine/threonine transporter SstT n=1 Tax=Clostridium sp. CMCC3677 TaxID=2949963 RepID=UPI0013F10C6E|nr:serine/threonine transporter SstT [Clostridium sp. CMCC3677]NFG62662.1 serine/threonine transporter SstT [Clostridium botulinum]NFQ09976.1 serine/threonine transporter SstT [Clostridium botulinum]
MKRLIEKWNNISLVKRIILGLILGIIIALTIPNLGAPISILGSLFVGALKAIAPLLVFFLVMAALSQYKEGKKTNMKSVILLYLLGTLSAGVVGVIGSFLFPVKLVLTTSVENLTPPSGVGEVLNNLLMSIVSNPVNALSNANYIGILFWAVILGLALKNANEGSKEVIVNISDAISQVVRWIINLAPFGIMGLVFDSISKQGIESLLKYGQLILVLVGCMAFFALVINPIITFIAIRKNPYPLVIKCLKDSGITAFFTRSSAANIPVNMKLCKELGLNEDTYSISIPLGATINMGGAAITISVLALAATNTLGITVDIGTTIILTLLSAVSACGTSGVAGGSLLLVPLACSLFGIPNDIAMQVVGVGFVIGVIQDSCETALNSSTDVLYTAVADFVQKHKLKS